MAERVVLLDWGGRCLELSAMDAAACRDSGMLQATFTTYGGELATATVLSFTQEYLAALGGHGELRAHNSGWEAVLGLPRHPRHEPFELSGTPAVGTAE